MKKMTWLIALCGLLLQAESVLSRIDVLNVVYSDKGRIEVRLREYFEEVDSLQISKEKGEEALNSYLEKNKPVVVTYNMTW